MVLKGLKFGMLLQLAVGPMCLMVFKTSSSLGVFSGLLLVLAIALVDAIYITLAGCGASAFLENEKIKKGIKIFGFLVLVLFGLNTILSVFQLSILPSIHLFDVKNVNSMFLQGLLLTASNPLTIIFWSGVFSAQIADYKLNKKQIVQFGFGCVLATILFLTFIAILGSVLNKFLPTTFVNILNIMIGAILIAFGVKLLIKK